jgi:hypothetical protein
LAVLSDPLNIAANFPDTELCDGVIAYERSASEPFLFLEVTQEGNGDATRRYGG